MKNQLYKCGKRYSMTIGCNIWMICLKLNWVVYGLSRMLQFSQFVWTLSYSVWDVINNFLLIDATDRSKISSDQKRFFIALNLNSLSFFANTPFNRFKCWTGLNKLLIIWSELALIDYQLFDPTTPKSFDLALFKLYWSELTWINYDLIWTGLNRLIDYLIWPGFLCLLLGYLLQLNSCCELSEKNVNIQVLFQIRIDVVPVFPKCGLPLLSFQKFPEILKNLFWFELIK